MGFGSKDSEKFLRLSHFTIERALAAIYWVDSRARIHRANEAACRMLGYTQEEFVSMTVQDLDPQSTRESWAAHWKELKAAKLLNMESVHRTRDGTLIPVEVYSNFIEFEGDEYSCCFVLDIRERKRAERALRFSDFTIEQSSEGIFWVDSKGRICQVNAAACRMLGYSKEELQAMTVFDINQEVRKEMWPQLWEDLKKDKVHIREGRYRTKDGRILPVEVLQNFLEFEGEEYSCSFVRDITERREAEKNLQNMTSEKDQFENELKFGSLVQSEFLPDEPPRYPGFSFAARMYPAKYVGGDFYDFIPFGGEKLALLMGDVSGKGVAAALYMARVMSDFRYTSQIDAEPRSVMNMVNRILSARARRGVFATAIYLLLDTRTRRLQVSNAGHHPILIREPGGPVVQRARASGPPLGIAADTDYSCDEIDLKTGDRVLLYTDGAIEAKNPQGEAFGVSRLIDCWRRNENPPNQLVADLKKGIGDFTGKVAPHDDLTFLEFQVL